MKLPHHNKPTLKDLFDSKKLDQPNDDFWDDFQDQVRSKTLSSVVTDSSRFSSRQLLAYSSCILIFFSITIFGFFEYNSKNKELLVELNPPHISSNPMIDLDKEVLISEDLNLLSSLNTENADFLDNDSNLFVEKSFHISSLETTFQHRVVVPQVENSDDSMIQFTF